MQPLTIGADPEFFVRKGRHFVSGHIFECGTKDQPMRTPHGSVQVDGIALECNVRPSLTKQGFMMNVKGVVNDLREVVKKVDPAYDLVARPSIFMGRKKLEGLPVVNGRPAGELGCTPDFNAYTRSQLPTPNSASPIRTGAGHIHLGWTTITNPRNKAHFDECCSLVKELDYYLGLPSLLWDNDQRRRSLYGQAGSFRPKPYGLEYRVLSNKWLETQGLIGYVFEQTTKAFHKWRSNIRLVPWYGDMAREYINAGKVNWRTETPGLAKELLS